MPEVIGLSVYVDPVFGQDYSAFLTHDVQNIFVRTSLGHWTYKPDYAQTYAKERRQATRYYYQFTLEVEGFVREKLQQEWSPEQISGYAKRWKLFSISHERIYQYVLQDKQKGGKLYNHLRHKH